jgi:hypothetical protein
MLAPSFLSSLNTIKMVSVNVKWFICAHCCMILDTAFSPSGADLGMDLGEDISESDFELDLAVSEAGSNSLDPILDQDPDDDDDDDEDEDDDNPDCHPALEPTSSADGCDNLFPEQETDGANLDEADTTAACPADLPEVVQKLQKQLLSGYRPPNHPPINDPRGRLLTSTEELSLKHFMAWVDSRGTVKAYSLHAQVLQEATNIEILSLYMVRKLAMELTGLKSQLVDMCPKSCMAFTGEFKNHHTCVYIRGGRTEPCGEPRYDKNNQPRAQMSYTPIVPVLQALYRNREMAEAMRYRHVHLQEALQNLEPDLSPAEYTDFSDSISHINHVRHLELFQDETDTAITISGDGAQLTMKKQSDVWVLVVTILNLPPNMRSRAANIIIPLVIPGPCSPGNVESFIYVLYEELAKLSVGVWTKDELSGNYFLLKVYLCGVLGDMLGSAKLSKMAGHMALHGCRFCTVRGARPSEKRGMT